MIKDDLDPRRCQVVIAAKGQCRNVSMDGSGFCQQRGSRNRAAIAKQEIYNYRLTKFQARMEEFANSDKVKSLREEIGLIRIMIEEIVNRCKDATELILMSGKISHLIMQAEKLVVSCHKLEASTGLLLDKTAVLQLAGVIINIIHQHVTDEKVIELVSDQIVNSIIEAQPSRDTSFNPVIAPLKTSQPDANPDPRG